MRIITALFLGGALALTGCSDDGSAAGGSGGSAGSGGENGTIPRIETVSWEAEPDCTSGVASDVVVTVIAVDTDTAPEDLIYNGSVGGCTGSIDAEVSTIRCPNVAPYPGNVVVSDPDGKESAPVAFDIGICDSGTCTVDLGVCVE